MSFLWNPYVMGAVTALLIVGFYCAIVVMVTTAFNGDSISRGEWFWTRSIVAIVVLSIVVTAWRGSEEPESFATAVYISTATVLTVGSLVRAIWRISYRKSRMVKAYKWYDEYEAMGYSPRIDTSSIFGPVVIADHPPWQYANKREWKDKAGRRCFSPRHALWLC